MSRFSRLLATASFAITACMASIFVSADASATTITNIKNLTTTGLYILSHGDGEYFGHGPAAGVTATLSISPDQTQVLVRLIGSANETGGDTQAGINSTRALFTVEPGNRILSIRTRTSGRFSYVDHDHEDDWVCENGGELAPVNSTHDLIIPGYGRYSCRTDFAIAARFVGDTNGQDVPQPLDDIDRRTQVQIFFNDIQIETQNPIAPTAAPDIPVPGGVNYEENLTPGENGCAASAGHRVLNAISGFRTYRQFLNLLRGMPNLTNIFNFGVAPGMLVDGLNKEVPGFLFRELAYNNDRTTSLRAQRLGYSNLRSNLISLLSQGRPVIALVGWGNRTVLGVYYRPNLEKWELVAENLYSPVHDDAQPDGLHYVAIKGFDATRKTFTVVDNGKQKIWREDYLFNVMVWDRGTDLSLLLGVSANDTRPATIIHRNR